MLKDYELDYKSDESQKDSEAMLKGIQYAFLILYYVRN